MKRKGFTLLELIVVLIVMASLVAIALPQYANFAEKGQAAEAINTISAIRNAEESEFLKRAPNGEYVNAGPWSTGVPTLGLTINTNNWSFEVTNASSTGCRITASRITGGCGGCGGCEGTASDQTIIMDIDHGQATWSPNSTHIGAPR